MSVAIIWLVAARASTPALADEPRPPGAGARAAIVVDADTGAVLYERDAHEELHPASLTKMVTALVAVERAPLDKVVRVTHQIDVVPVTIGLEPGDALPLGDVLYGLLLDSGNDAAVAIAESVGDGSTARFVGWMNQLAVELGLTNTRFKNPHGLDADGHVSSAYDMAIVGRALMRQTVLAGIVAQGRHVVEGPPRWVFRTRNPLLGVYDGVDGIKTGYDDLAGRCLVATATRDGRRAIAVVMNSPRYDLDAASLLDYAFGDGEWGHSGQGKAERKPTEPRIAMLRADMQGAGIDAPPVLGRALRATIASGGGS
ncbi:MAG: D-alanyl-D-alanine carboxypeptidase family protein [Chloroflexota bacterium]